MLDYLGGLLPNPREHACVIGLLPLSCSDFDGYARLVLSITPGAHVEPWLAPLRVVVYDDRSQHVITQVLSHAGVERALSYEVDFSTPALTDALSRDAADTSLSVPDRMASLLQLAALDYSYQRYPEALQKYGVLHDYYAKEGIPSMQALCLLGAGDTLRAGGEPAAGKDMVQRSIALCLEHKILAVLQNALLSARSRSIERMA